MVASVVVLPLPVGPVTTIMPCGNASSRVMTDSSFGARPSLLISSRPRSRGSRRITALSECCVGMVATRTSSSERLTRTRAAPSCGSRRSAMFSPARIFTREISACGGMPDGAFIARNKPSTRMRTTRPVRNGSMWISEARSSTARSSRSLSARTTGAPLARSRRLSMSSSDCCVDPFEPSSALASPASTRWSSTVVMSSNEATATSTAEPNTISAARMAAVSDGSATASR